MEDYERAGKGDFTYNLIEVLLRLRPCGACRRRALLWCHCAVRWQTSTGWSIADAHRSRRSSPIRGAGHGDVFPSLLSISEVLLSPQSKEGSRRVAHQGRVGAQRGESTELNVRRDIGASYDTFRWRICVDVWLYGCQSAEAASCSHCGEKTGVRLVAPACRGSCGVVGFTA